MSRYNIYNLRFNYMVSCVGEQHLQYGQMPDDLVARWPSFHTSRDDGETKSLEILTALGNISTIYTTMPIITIIIN